MTDQRPPSADIDGYRDTMRGKTRNGLTGGSDKGLMRADENEVVGGGAVVGGDEGSSPATLERNISSLVSGDASSSRGKATSGVAATPPPAKPVLLVESDDDVEEWPEVPLIGRYREEEEGDEENGNVSGDDQGEPAHNNTDGEEEGEEGCDHELFWKHKVKQNDTLAGLAVKYKVSISDIKRANGFQTDTAMFGREWVMIPRKPFPIGPEQAAWAGMILAHYEQRMPFGMHPEGNGMNDKPLTSVRALRGYYSTDHSPVRQQHGVDWEAEGASKKNEDGHFVAPASTRGEVEMMSRSTSSYRDDRLRRRRNDDTDEYSMTTPLRNDAGDYDENDPAVRQVFEAMRDRDMPKPLFGRQTTAALNSWKEKSSVISSNAMKELKDLQTKSLKWRDQLMRRIKKVTNAQPGPSSSAAAGTAMSSFSSSIKKD
ncbi:hypothetical protein M9435_000325 [Picochlorum sp. BPE23]|nr:hypothetical protein M9435_000325 [Picochlorum sp. BPE23]